MPIGPTNAKHIRVCQQTGSHVQVKVLAVLTVSSNGSGPAAKQYMLIEKVAAAVVGVQRAIPLVHSWHVVDAMLTI